MFGMADEHNLGLTYAARSRAGSDLFIPVNNGNRLFLVGQAPVRVCAAHDKLMFVSQEISITIRCEVNYGWLYRCRQRHRLSSRRSWIFSLHAFQRLKQRPRQKVESSSFEQDWDPLHLLQLYTTDLWMTWEVLVQLYSDSFGCIRLDHDQTCHYQPSCEDVMFAMNISSSRLTCISKLSMSRSHGFCA